MDHIKSFSFHFKTFYLLNFDLGTFDLGAKSPHQMLLPELSLSLSLSLSFSLCVSFKLQIKEPHPTNASERQCIPSDYGSYPGHIQRNDPTKTNIFVSLDPGITFPPFFPKTRALEWTLAVQGMCDHRWFSICNDLCKYNIISMYNNLPKTNDLFMCNNGVITYTCVMAYNYMYVNDSSSYYN